MAVAIAGVVAGPAFAANAIRPAPINDLGSAAGSTGHVTVYGPNHRYLQDANGVPFALVGFGNEGRNTPAVMSQLAGKIDYQRAYATSWDSGRSPDEYVRGLAQAGVKRVTSRVLPGSGELSPLEVPQQFTQVLLDFARECRGS